MKEFFKGEWKVISLIIGVFLICFYLPVGSQRFDNAVLEAFYLVKWYAREHVLLCLIPAFFIAGAIGVFISQASVMKYLGPNANKVLAYGVASVSGTILAVCSCTVLPLFAGIYRMGAGLGPACTFLYSGPAINVLAIVLTARILGFELGVARAIGAISFSIIVGILMQIIFWKEDSAKLSAMANMPAPEVKRQLWKNALYFAGMVAILVFANWGSPNNYIFELKDGRTLKAAILLAPEDPGAPEAEYKLKVINDNKNIKEEISIKKDEIKSITPISDIWSIIWKHKWHITAISAILFGIFLILWFSVPVWKILLSIGIVAIFAILTPSSGLWILLPFSSGVILLSWILLGGTEELREWFTSSWTFAKQILPLLLGGVVVAGFLLGRVGHEGIIPSKWVEWAVGGNSIRANFLASFVGAFMYFATLTEVPILQGLIGSGMGKGPALALLLAGPALSLPNMLVIRSIMGTKKTIVFVSIVIILSTITGVIYGTF